MAMPARRLVSRVGRSLSPSPALLSCFGRSVGSPVRHNKLEHHHASPVRHLISGTGYSCTHKGVSKAVRALGSLLTHILLQNEDLLYWSIDC
jgi:hypothetical protein